MLPSEIPDHYKDWYQDIARLKEGSNQTDLSYTSEDSENVIQHLQFVKHKKGIYRRELKSWTPSLQDLQSAIKNLYSQYTPDPKLVLQSHQSNVEQIFLSHGNQRLAKDPDVGGLLLALNFFTGVYDSQGGIFKSGADLCRNANVLTSSKKTYWEREKYGVQIDEVNKWMEKAFGLIDPFVGRCHKYDFLDQAMIGYYEPGKIIQWNKFSSAFAHVQGDSVPAYLQKGVNYNTMLHIYSVSGRNLFPYSSFKNIECEVLFSPGTQFLVCKKSFDHNKGLQHIFLREVVVGIQQNVIFWLDDLVYAALDPEKAVVPNTLSSSQQQHMSLIKLIYNQAYQMNFHIILKSSLTTARSYIISDLFKYSSEISRKFKFVLNQCYNSKPKAGCLFFGKLLTKEKPEDFRLTYKNVLIFGEDNEEAKKQLKELEYESQGGLPTLMEQSGVEEFFEEESQKAIEFVFE